MNAIILAGGKGTRIKGQRAPKPLVKISDSVKLIDHTIRQLLRSGVVHTLIISLGHHAAELRKHLNTYPKHVRDQFQFVYEKKALGTGGAIRRALSFIEDMDEPVLVVNGDIVSDLNPSALLAQHQLLEKGNAQAVTLAAVAVDNGAEDGLLDYKSETWKVRGFHEKEGKKEPAIVNAGWYVITKRAFEQHAPESQDVFSIERDVFPHLAAAGHLRLFPHKGQWSNVHTFETLQEIRSDYA